MFCNWKHNEASCSSLVSLRVVFMLQYTCTCSRVICTPGVAAGVDVVVIVVVY